MEDTRAQREVLLVGCKMQGFIMKAGFLNGRVYWLVTRKKVTWNYLRFWLIFMPYLTTLLADQTITTASH